MKIAVLIPLIVEINTLVDLNLIQNVEENNFDWICKRTLYCNVEELGSKRQHSGTQIRSWRISRRTNSSWSLLVAELAARRACRGELAARGACRGELTARGACRGELAARGACRGEFATRATKLF